MSKSQGLGGELLYFASFFLGYSASEIERSQFCSVDKKKESENDREITNRAIKFSTKLFETMEKDLLIERCYF